MSESTPLVAVVVLNYNGKKFLDACLHSLRKTSYRSFRIYLLDNASTEDDVVYVKEHFPEVSIIQNAHNNGYCAAYNLALHHCKETYIVCLNNDTEVSEGWLGPLVEMMRSNPQIGALQPKMLQMKNRKMFEYSGASGGFMDRFGFPYMRGRIFSCLEEDCGQYNESCKIFWASGACLMLDRQKALAIGGFDPVIVHHMDEIDLCWRFHLIGYQVWVVPQSHIYHWGGATITESGYKKIYWNHRNALYIMFKNLEAKNIFFRVGIHLILDVLAMLMYLGKGRVNRMFAIIHAHFWNLFHATTILKSRREVQQNRMRKDEQLGDVVLNKSVVWAFYFRGQKFWSQLYHKYKNEN